MIRYPVWPLITVKYIFFFKKEQSSLWTSLSLPPSLSHSVTQVRDNISIFAFYFSTYFVYILTLSLSLVCPSGSMMEIQALRITFLNLSRGSSATYKVIPQYFKDSFTLNRYDKTFFPILVLNPTQSLGCTKFDMLRRQTVVYII